jgi:hypothetical protein
MMTQTTNRSVVFSHPFSLAGVDGPQPAGTYVVETDEELIQEVSCRAFRRVATWIRLPSPVARPSYVAVTAMVDPAELAAALAKDAAMEGADLPVSTIQAM